MGRVRMGSDMHLSGSQTARPSSDSITRLNSAQLSEFGPGFSASFSSENNRPEFNLQEHNFQNNPNTFPQNNNPNVFFAQQIVNPPSSGAPVATRGSQSARPYYPGTDESPPRFNQAEKVQSVLNEIGTSPSDVQRIMAILQNTHPAGISSLSPSNMEFELRTPSHTSSASAAS